MNRNVVFLLKCGGHVPLVCSEEKFRETADLIKSSLERVYGDSKPDVLAPFLNFTLENGFTWVDLREVCGVYSYEAGNAHSHLDRLTAVVEKAANKLSEEFGDDWWKEEKKEEGNGH